MTLDQRGHVAVARPAEEIALPVAGDGPVFHLHRPFADREGYRRSDHGGVRSRGSRERRIRRCDCKCRSSSCFSTPRA